MWQNKQFRVRLEEDTVNNFERIMLTSGECKGFIPMGFINDDGKEYGFYECSGFAPLKCYRIERTEDALYIMENVLLILEKGIEFFINPAKVTVTCDTVFYNKDTGQVKIAYVPVHGPEYDLKRNLSDFAEQIRSDICDGKQEYIYDIVKYICLHNYGLREAADRLALMKRRLYMESEEKVLE